MRLSKNSYTLCSTAPQKIKMAVREVADIHYSVNVVTFYPQFCRILWHCQFIWFSNWTWTNADFSSVATWKSKQKVIFKKIDGQYFQIMHIILNLKLNYLMLFLWTVKNIS
jgi:hypothetical protein